MLQAGSIWKLSPAVSFTEPHLHYGEMTCSGCHPWILRHACSHTCCSRLSRRAEPPPASDVVLPVSVSVSVCYIGWREGDVFITVGIDSPEGIDGARWQQKLWPWSCELFSPGCRHGYNSSVFSSRTGLHNRSRRNRHHSPRFRLHDVAVFIYKRLTNLIHVTFWGDHLLREEGLFLIFYLWVCADSSVIELGSTVFYIINFLPSTSSIQLSNLTIEYNQERKLK